MRQRKIIFQDLGAIRMMILNGMAHCSLARGQALLMHQSMKTPAPTPGLCGDQRGIIGTYTLSRYTGYIY